MLYTAVLVVRCLGTAILEYIDSIDSSHAGRTSLHSLHIMMHGSAVLVLYHCKSFNYANYILYIWASIALLYVELCFREYS